VLAAVILTSGRGGSNIVYVVYVSNVAHGRLQIVTSTYSQLTLRPSVSMQVGLAFQQSFCLDGLGALGALGAPIYRYVLDLFLQATSICCVLLSLCISLHFACMQCIHVFMWVLSVYSAL
jgi:hypothetical protein